MTADMAAPPAAGRLVTLPPALVAAVAAASTAAVVVRAGLNAEAILLGALAAVLVVLSAIDLRERRLPNAIVGPSMLLVLLARGGMAPGDLPEHLLAGLGAGAFLLLPLVVSPGGVGMGDVKLAALLGFALGVGVVQALFIGFVSVLPVALVLVIRHGSAARQATLPLGPFLAFGALVAILVQA